MSYKDFIKMVNTNVQSLKKYMKDSSFVGFFIETVDDDMSVDSIQVYANQELYLSPKDQEDPQKVAELSFGPVYARFKNGNGVHSQPVIDCLSIYDL